MKLRICVARNRHGGYTASCPSLPGCVCQGDTSEEATSRLVENIHGYILLDLFPRPGKYTHACHRGILNAIKPCPKAGGMPSVGIVVANFPKPVGDRPALLLHEDVATFFHEFGHAIHHLVGRTELGRFSGHNVCRDFIETPSQMFEEWMWDRDMLKLVSSHYETGEPLPDDLMDKKLELKTFGAGHFVKHMVLYSLLSLNYYLPGAEKDTDEIKREAWELCFRFTEYDPETHKQASFGHLMHYGAKYYSYLWSQVFSLDLFEHVKQYGLLNPEVGKRFVAQVLGRGGSEEPGKLLKDFLGRPPNQEAFLRGFGFTE